MYQFKLKAMLIHFGLAFAIVCLTFLMVWYVWYPFGLFSVVGGVQLFVTLTVIELSFGPLLTLIVANEKKSKRQLFIDFSIVGFLQACVFSYGLYSVYISRPVFLVFAIDRVEIVSNADLLELSHDGYVKWMPSIFSGPSVLVAKMPESIDERNNLLFETVVSGGADLHLRPSLYHQFEGEILLRSVRHVDELKLKFKQVSLQIPEPVQRYLTDSYAWIPAHSYFGFSTAIIDREDGNPVFFIDFDAF